MSAEATPERDEEGSLHGDQGPEAATALSGERLAGVFLLVAAALWCLAALAGVRWLSPLVSAGVNVPLAYFLVRGRVWAAKPAFLVLCAGLAFAAFELGEAHLEWLTVPGLLVVGAGLLLFNDESRGRTVVGSALLALHALAVGFLILLATADWD